MRLFPIIMIVLILFPTTHIFGGGVGTTGTEFLKIGVGARSRAMGEAFVALADDVNTINVNPAGLNNIKSISVSFMHLEWLDTMDFEYLTFSRPFGKNVLGASIIFFHMPDFIHFGSAGQETGELNISDLAITLGYGRQIMGISLGGNFKFIRRTITDVSANAYAVDFGLLKDFSIFNYFKNTPRENLTLGIALQNLGTKIKFLAEEDPLSLNLKIGLAYNISPDFKISFDINKPNDVDRYKFLYNLGAEYKFFNLIGIRGGYKFGYELDSYSFGGGIDYKLGGAIYSFDYALTPLGRKNTHAFSLAITP